MNEDVNGCLESCDMFDFMSTHVGLNVLHPGGLASTRDLLGKLRILGSDRVLDIACGKGVNSVFMAQRFGCRVVGIDILEDSIEKARALARKRGVADRIEFRVDDAGRLPFGEDEFDATIAQAMLILVGDMPGVIREAQRVLKPGGRSGWLELSWKNTVTDAFLKIANEELCGFCISNVKTFDGWKELFERGGYGEIETSAYTMKYRGMGGMIRDEGLGNGLRVMARVLGNRQIRSRMRRLSRFFDAYSESVGYGIYIGRNGTLDAGGNRPAGSPAR